MINNYINYSIINLEVDMNIKIGVSNHHIHLTKEVLEILFGKGYKLTPKRYLTQKGQ